MASSFSSPWPDPNSPVLSKIEFDVPLVELFKWLDVRDTLLGLNYKKQDSKAALALARDCKHHDALWLTSIFEGKDVSTEEDARKVFVSLKDDARALCFAWWLSDDRGRDFALLHRASEMGYAFACSTLSGQVWNEDEEQAFGLARLAASKQERDGFYWLGFCFDHGLGREMNGEEAAKGYLIAAELGHVSAGAEYGKLLQDSDAFRWVWLARSALHGDSFQFVYSIWNEIELFVSGSGNACNMFLMGLALKGNISIGEQEIFGWETKLEWISSANLAVSFYDSQIKSARSAIDTWTLVGMRAGIMKDMRIYVGKMIWDARFEANYKY